MTTHADRTPAAYVLPGFPGPTIRDTEPDRAGALLDELDSLITELDSAIGDQNTARLVLADAELELSVIEASLTLTTEGKNEAERKARLVLALRDDGGYQTLASAAREARAAVHDTERRLTVIKERCRLVRAALALAAGAGGLS